MKIRLRYFAKFQELAGRPEEWLETGATTPGQLWPELVERHGFPSLTGAVMVAQNDDFCAWGDPLLEGGTLVFLPPVSGG